jgi:hypothetical protein
MNNQTLSEKQKDAYTPGGKQSHEAKTAQIVLIFLSHQRLRKNPYKRYIEWVLLRIVERRHEMSSRYEKEELVDLAYTLRKPYPDQLILV